MIHGGAEFMGIPWLRQYADGFIDWIKSSNLLFPPTLQQQFLLGGVRAGFQEFKNQMQHRVSDSIKKHGPISETGVKQIVALFPGAPSLSNTKCHSRTSEAFRSKNKT